MLSQKFQISSSKFQEAFLGFLNLGLGTWVFFLFSFSFFSSCSNSQQKSQSEKLISPPIQTTVHSKDTTLQKGIVHQNISSRKDASQSYALYLPSNYPSDKLYPVIYFFDSHAEGALPVEKYKSLAEKFGYIIAGSNISKNGVAAEILQKHIAVFFEDVNEKFSIDPKRIYTGGFSGGSRVASSIALNKGGIEGVVGCGAGFPNISEPIHNKFNFIGIAGNADFNLIELKKLDEALEDSYLNHELIFFDGKHEWPPVSIMEDAFVWFDLNAMKDGIIPKNDSIIEKFRKGVEKDMMVFSKKNQSLDLVLTYKKAINYLKGIADVKAYGDKLAELEKSPEYLVQHNQQAESEKKELLKQREYSSSLTSQNYEWWKVAINNLRSEKSLESKRMLGFLGLAAYMYSNSALSKNMLPETDNFLKIYTLIEPENPEHQYLRAQLYVKLNQPEQALASLKAAIVLGFKDKARLDKEEIFISLRKKQGYVDIEKML